MPLAGDAAAEAATETEMAKDDAPVIVDERVLHTSGSVPLAGDAAAEAATETEMAKDDAPVIVDERVLHTSGSTRSAMPSMQCKPSFSSSLYSLVK